MKVIFFHFESVPSTAQIHPHDFNFIKLLSLLKIAQAEIAVRDVVGFLHRF